jgi:hypothetical protein
MGESRSRRHGRARAAAVLAFCGLVAACSSVPGEPAPVYMMGGRPTGYQSMASAPIQQQAMAPVAPAPGPSMSSRHLAPDVIPLDNPPTARAASSAGAPVHRAVPPATASRSPPAGPSVRVRTEPETAKANPALAALPHGAHFSWPLNGRILAGFGAAPDGGRNDGISIEAPRGAPVTRKPSQFAAPGLLPLLPKRSISTRRHAPVGSTLAARRAADPTRSMPAQVAAPKRPGVPGAVGQGSEPIAPTA